MAYIGFFLIMAGLAAAGSAIDKGGSLATAVAMTAAGAALMWLFREEDEDSEEKNDSHVSRSGGSVDKPAGECAGGSETDPTCIFRRRKRWRSGWRLPAAECTCR